jgi:mannose-6-phosphate isomerase-like protein (cupin superfamily)
LKINLNDTIAKLQGANKKYLEFLKVPSMSAGIYQLSVGDQDLQQPHTEDEIYYIIKGKAKFFLNGEHLDVSEGTTIFVYANLPHYFHSIAEDLTILVVFSPAEFANKK